MKKILITAWYLIFTLPLMTQNLWGGLEQGHYDIEFQTIMTYDLSQPALTEQHDLSKAQRLGRAMQINIWYPAENKEQKEKLSLNDYLLLEGKAIDFELSGEAQRQKAKQFFFRYVPKYQPYFDSLFLLNLPMRAIRNARPANGKFPCILLMHQDAPQVCVTAEYLASHGFVVVNYPVLGSFSVDFDFQETTGLETEVRDMEFAVSELKKLSFADFENIGLIGISYGAMSVMAYQLRNPAVKAVISLDGGITDSWGFNLLRNMPYFNLERFDVPLMLFWISIDGWNHDMALFKAFKHAPRYAVETPELRHQDFTNYGLFGQYFPDWNFEEIGTPKVDYISSYEWVTRYVKAFLSAHLQRDVDGHAFLAKTPEVNGVPSKMFRIKEYPALPKPPDSKELNELFQHEGFTMVRSLHDKLKQKDTQPFPARTYFQFATILVRAEALSEAMEWAKRFEESYPDSGLAAYATGVIFAEQNQKEASVKAFKKAIALLPSDPALDHYLEQIYLKRAEERLAELEGKK